MGSLQTARNGVVQRDQAIGQRTATPPLPDMAVTPPAINHDGSTALFNALQRTGQPISSYFGSKVLIANRKYRSKEHMKKVTWLKFDSEREVTRRKYVQATYDAVGKQVTLD